MAAGEERTVAEALGRMLAAGETLLREHVSLARAELQQDLSAARSSAVLLLAASGALLAGWALAMALLARSLAGPLGLGGSLAVLSAGNLAFGLFLARRAMRKLDGMRAEQAAAERLAARKVTSLPAGARGGEHGATAAEAAARSLRDPG